MRKLSRREKLLLGLVAATAVVAAWVLLRTGAAPVVLSRSRPDPPLPPVPRIGLARLDAPRPENDAGRRNLFAFGAEAMPEEVAPPPVVVATPPPVVGAGGLAEGAAGSTALPPLNLKYMGSVENKTGVKVAVLLTDRREVLTGQAGQVVANRYRIARIGLESVDLEDVGTGQSRRIPLRGN